MAVLTSVLCGNALAEALQAPGWVENDKEAYESTATHVAPSKNSLTTALRCRLLTRVPAKRGPPTRAKPSSVFNVSRACQLHYSEIPAVCPEDSHRQPEAPLWQLCAIWQALLLEACSPGVSCQPPRLASPVILPPASGGLGSAGRSAQQRA